MFSFSSRISPFEKYMAKIYHLFKVDKNKIQPCCVAHVVHSILNNIVDPESCVTMLNNIVDNIEQCMQDNIVQSVPINLKQAIIFAVQYRKVAIRYFPLSIFHTTSHFKAACEYSIRIFTFTARTKSAHSRQFPLLISFDAATTCSRMLSGGPGCVKIIGYIVMLRARMFRSLI